MEFINGTKVLTSDGRDAGNLHRVVIDPDTKQVTHIVIQKGFLFKDDKVVNIAKVIAASADQIVLTCTMDELKEMAPLEIKDYEPINEATVGNESRIPNVFSPGTSYGTFVVKEVKRTIPEELAALKDGAQVLSAEGEHVGHTEQVHMDPETSNVTQFIITEGAMAKKRKSIPVEWVRMIDDEQVFLNVPAQEVANLPEVQA